MANEEAGTSLDVDRAVSEAVARAMSAITAYCKRQTGLDL